MNANEVFKLLEAGFTKAEIMALKEGTTPEPAPVPNEPAPAPVVTEPAPQPTGPQAAAAPVVTDAQIEKLAQLINVGKATIDVPPTVTLDDQLEAHFRTLMTGGQ